MKTQSFQQMLEQRWSKGCFVSVGLDTDRSKISDTVEQHLVGDAMGDQGGLIWAFNRHIIDETHDLACAYKPNSAFYEKFGAEGIEALRRTIAYIHERAPDVPVILDAKRGDIGNTNNGYVYSAFDKLAANAITVNPYFGPEASKPFLERDDKGIVVLCRTSNPGAEKVQNQMVIVGPGGKILDPSQVPASLDECIIQGFEIRPFYQVIARQIAEEWNVRSNCALVVGATCPEELAEVRGIVGDMPILIPGIGAQGGDVEKTVQAGRDSRGMGMIINSSRGIIFASEGTDFAVVARQKTEELNNQIIQCL